MASKQFTGHIYKSKSCESILSSPENTNKNLNNSNEIYLPNQVKKLSNTKENSVTAMLNTKYGWKMVLYPGAMFSQSLDLLRTDDGGKTWVKVTSTSNEGSSILSGGDKIGVSILDRQKGWITASTPNEGEIPLYVSKNGGSKWEKQNVEVPGKYGGTMF